MSNIAIIGAGQKRKVEAVRKIKDTAFELGFKDLPAEMRFDDFTGQLYIKAPGHGWEYDLEFSEDDSPYGINVWLSANNHAAGLSYNIMSLYDSAYQYIVDVVDRYLYLLKMLLKLPDLDFSKSYVKMYLDNWYTDSIIESLP